MVKLCLYATARKIIEIMGTQSKRGGGRGDQLRGRLEALIVTY
jgi:hypothetical protein